MPHQHKKELLWVALIVALAVVAGLFLISGRPIVETIRAEEETILATEDFYVSTGNGMIKVGESSWEDIQKLLPGGKMLGMSTIYQSKEKDSFFTFTEDENILVIMHIDESGYTTARGIKVGDSPERITEEYGPYCARVIMPKKAGDYDLVYGGEDNIVFQIRDNFITRIVLEKEL